jgi:GGDEF domain-containing protein
MNTVDIIPEKWAGLKGETCLPRPPQFHLAVRQKGVSLDLHLHNFFRNQHPSLHFFETFDQLIVICQRFQVDAIFIAGKGEFLDEIALGQSIKHNVFLSLIPVIFCHPDPHDSALIAAFESGAEEFITGELRERLAEVRIKRIIDNSRRELSINASTRLPGTATIEREINQQLTLKTEFAMCYADLDNFKSYNDYYGYFYGDRVIRLSARIIKDVVFDLCREGFVGHIAGDDFIFVVPPSMVDQVCSGIIKTFDCLIPWRYDPVDQQRGFITTKSRRGEIENFPILTISIAVLPSTVGEFAHIGEMSKMLADLKRAAKAQLGSVYMVERRKKY